MVTIDWRDYLTIPIPHAGLSPLIFEEPMTLPGFQPPNDVRTMPMSDEELVGLLSRLDTSCAMWATSKWPEAQAGARCGLCEGCSANRLAKRLVNKGPNQ